ncbi:MAG: hypothetical protein ACETVR_01850 [Candidatus Bathyarchaeia archaeon]
MKTVLKIDKVEYSKSGDTAEVTFSFYVTYPSPLGGMRSEGDSFSVVIKASEDEIKRLKDKVEENRAEVNKALDEIKDKIKKLSILGSPVVMSLSEIVDELLEVAKRGLDIKEKTSKGKGAVETDC